MSTRDDLAADFERGKHAAFRWVRVFHAQPVLS